MESKVIQIDQVGGPENMKYRSVNLPKPGKGQGEATSDVNKYSELITLANKNKEWRRMLDDSYIQAMMIDGKKWSSVKHFMLGSQFKRKNIDL